MLPFPFPSPNSDRARIAVLFLYGMSAFYAIDMLSNLLLSGIFPAVPGNVAATAQQFLGSVGFIQLIAFLSTAVYFLQWFSRAYNNLYIVGARLRFEKGWAIGAWFVPILNYIRPYRIMQEIWVETQLMGLTAGEKKQPAPLTNVNLWWIASIAAIIPSQFYMPSLINAILEERIFVPTPSDHLAMTISALLQVISGLLLISIIRKVSVWEVELHDRYQRFVYQQQAKAEPAADPQ